MDLAAGWAFYVDILSESLFAISDVFIDIFVFIFGLFLGLITRIIAELPGVPGAEVFQQYYNMIPLAAREMASRLGIGEMSAMLASAYALRFSLALIPFLRTGG